MGLPQPGQRFARRFDLNAVLGRGGFATVFDAVDLATNTRVALKILHLDEGDQGAMARRFEREVRIVGQLRDPHTVQLMAHGFDDGVHWAAFELVPGQDLANLLKQRGRLTAAETVAVLEQILRSLSEAHSAGLIHRDLKPENVRVFPGARGPLTVKVLDFGIARPTDVGHPSVTKTGELVGTPRYMSPEQLRGDPLQPASDVYTVGLMGYELLAGADALPGGAIGQQLVRLLPEHRYEMTGAGAEDQALLDKLRRFLDVDPKRRLSSADAALRVLFPGVSTAPDPTPAEAQEQAQDWKLAVIALALALAVIAGVVVVGSMMVDSQENRPSPDETTTRTNPLAVAPDKPVRAEPPKETSAPTDEDAPSDSCEKRPANGVGQLPSDFGGLVYVPKGFHAPTASVILTLYNIRIYKAEEAFEKLKLRELADQTNAIVVLPRDTVEGRLDKAWAGQYERLWAEVGGVRKAWCLSKNAPVFAFAAGKNATRGMEELLLVYGDTLAGVIFSGGIHRVASQASDVYTDLAAVVGRPPSVDKLEGSAPMLDILEEGDPDFRIVSKDRGESFHTRRERQEMLRQVHQCEGDRRAYQPQTGWDCTEHVCETPLELCTTDAGAMHEPSGGPIPGFVARMAARHFNGSTTCGERPSNGIWRLPSGTLAYQPKTFVPTAASVVLALGRTEVNDPVDLLDAWGLRELAESSNSLVIIPMSDSEEGEGGLLKAWNARALQRALGEVDVFEERACVPRDARRFGVSADIIGSQGMELLVRENPNLMTAIAFRGAQYKQSSALKEKAGKLFAPVGRPSSGCLLLGTVPLLDVSMTELSSIEREFNREDTQARHQTLRSAYHCGELAATTNHGERTCITHEGCTAPLVLCTEEELEKKFGDETIQFFEEAARWRAEGDQ